MRHPSTRGDYLISLIHGKHYELLRQHLTRHGYTPNLLQSDRP